MKLRGNEKGERICETAANGKDSKIRRPGGIDIVALALSLAAFVVAIATLGVAISQLIMK